MKFSAIVKTISSAILLASMNNVYASDAVCPDLSLVRQKGSTFNLARQFEGSEWSLMSKPFEYGDEMWQTIFTFKLPVASPSIAIEEGTALFKQTAFPTKADVAVFGTQTTCSYTVKGSPYALSIQTPVQWGLS